MVLTGMSGAGRSSAAKILEDTGYTVIDNLPPPLLDDAVQHHDLHERRKRLAVVIDSRGGLPIGELKEAVTELARQGVRTLVVFLDAEDETIVRRYAENRRPHPLGGATITDSINAERALLDELREMADVVIDTSELNVHGLRERLISEFSEADRPEMRVSLRSFGFKHGAPRDVDIMFDVRFLPNPHWVAELRPLRGTDPQVADYVMEREEAGAFLDKVEDLLTFLIPRFEAEGKSYLSIGIGCTGGHHRSVALVEALRGRLSERGIPVSVRHRDIST